MAESSGIGFAQLGLASILKQNTLKVPPNQRDYSWTTKEVRTMFQDFAAAIAAPEKGTYFLGTIVTIPKDDGVLEVVDGQQRLATVAMLLAAIRNYLQSQNGGNSIIAEALDNEHLTTIDRVAGVRIPRLQLNVTDNDYFRARLTNEQPKPKPVKHSQQLIEEAFQEATSQVKNIVSSYDPKQHKDILNTWISFTESRAVAVLLQVPNDSDAYRMFETLNDRGLRTSQSDLVKNYLFGRSGDRMQEVQQRWSFMKGSLESVDDDDQFTILFLRHALTAIYGFTREAEVYEKVQRYANTPQLAVSFASHIETLASNYAAIFNPDHEKWNPYFVSTRKALEVLNLFGIKPIRPLLLSTAEKMSIKEVDKCYQFYVSLCVRLMIASSTRTGNVEEGLAQAAYKIYNGEITAATEVRDELRTITPTDERFRNSFETATVSNNKLARYYLRSLELTAKGESVPWHIPNDDRDVINLEHVLPEKPEDNWPEFSQDEAKLYYKRLGNLALMRAKDNSHVKNSSFAEKKKSFSASPYELTKQIADWDSWTLSEIQDRQKTLAEYAVKTWPKK